MNVEEALKKRRSFRALAPIRINEKIITELGRAAQLMPSCYNKQPWRFVFVYEEPILQTLKDDALNPGNRWAKAGSMIIAVFSKEELDCVSSHNRKYYLFDTGMAVGAILLRATELGLVAHPIAGYDPQKAKEILNIPKDHNLITLVIIGKKAKSLPEFFETWQIESEQKRPERKVLHEIIYRNKIDNFTG